MPYQGFVNFEGPKETAELLLRLNNIPVSHEKPRRGPWYIIYCRNGKLYAQAKHVAPILDAFGIEHPWKRPGFPDLGTGSPRTA